MKSTTQNAKIAAITEKTLIIGIDVGSETHFARAFNWRGYEFSRKPLEFSNTEEGFETFRIWIEEDTLTSKAALHGAVGIIPVVQDAQVVEGLLCDVEAVARLSRLLQAQQVVGTVEQSCIVRSRDHGLSPLTLDGVSIFGQALLSFQYHRSALPVGLQLGHGRTLDSCDC